MGSRAPPVALRPAFPPAIPSICAHRALVAATGSSLHSIASELFIMEQLLVDLDTSTAVRHSAINHNADLCSMTFTLVRPSPSCHSAECTTMSECTGSWVHLQLTPPRRRPPQGSAVPGAWQPYTRCLLQTAAHLWQSEHHYEPETSSSAQVLTLFLLLARRACTSCRATPMLVHTSGLHTTIIKASWISISTALITVV